MDIRLIWNRLISFEKMNTLVSILYKRVFMKKVLSVFVSVLLISTSLFAKEYKEDEVKECGDLLCDLDGNLITGIAKEFYYNGNIQSEMELKNGLNEEFKKNFEQKSNVNYFI